MKKIVHIENYVSVLVLSLSIALTDGSFGQWTGPRPQPSELKDVKFGPLNKPSRDDAAMRAFRGYGLGQFIHWGLYAIPGNEWEGVSARRGAAASEWIRAWSGPTRPDNWTEIYDNLYRQFNPQDFDARKWARQAKQMGARYLIFTTKHHDGFALWPTKYSDYNISQTPYQKDIVKEVVDAYTAEGIDVFLYFSVLEWNNPDYLYKKPANQEEQAKFDRFLTYTRNQILELLENYPSAKGLWFDGTWDQSWVSAYEFTYQLEQDIRQQYPEIIIGSRFRNDEFGKRHFDSNGRLLGDYEQGWERKMPNSIEWLNGNDWDCVMTIPPNGWGYMKDWSGLYTKTPYDIIELLMRANSMNGNFVLNFGPDGDGNMHPGEDLIAEQLGQWMATNGEAVYETTHANFPKCEYGYMTRRDQKLYLTVFNKPVNGIIRLPIPKNSQEVPVSASLLSSQGALDLRHSDIGFDRDPNTYYDIELPADHHAAQPFVIKMQLGSPKQFAEQLMEAQK